MIPTHQLQALVAGWNQHTTHTHNAAYHITQTPWPAGRGRRWIWHSTHWTLKTLTITW